MTAKIHYELQRIIDYEAGRLDFQEIIKLFSDLVSSGLAWSLQGNYGRAAKDLIEAGYLDKDGTIDWTAVDLTQENQP